MVDTLTFNRFAELKGADVRSADGEKIGRVNAVFCTQRSRRPEWIGLGTGFLGLKEAVVPVRGARIDSDEIVVPYDGDVIKDEPPFDQDGGALTPQSDHSLRVYFSLTGHRPAPRELTRYDFMRSDSE